jgi:phospholipase C
MHPSGNVSTGQVLLKQIYDAVRTGPQWDKTLLLITFDETGGFYDHVAPPLAVRPDNKTYTEKATDGSTYTLNFDRLGGRMPTWLVSPYTPQGHIENFGIDPATGKSASYSATSVLKTLGYLWDLQDFTPRVSHSPAFDHLIGPNARRNTPTTLANPHPFPEAV